MGAGTIATCCAGAPGALTNGSTIATARVLRRIAMTCLMSPHPFPDRQSASADRTIGAPRRPNRIEPAASPSGDPLMRAIVTGQIGMDKKPYLKAVADLAGQTGEPIALLNIGDMMYAEGKDVRPGRILGLPISRLNSLRRGAFKDVISQADDHRHVIVNTHATFRWRHGLFAAFDFDQVAAFKPDLFICLVDNIETVHHRLHRDFDIDATLKDCMVWREEEILATEILTQAVQGSKFYIVSRGRHNPTIRTAFRLICRSGMKKVYPSFPMSHVVDMPEVRSEERRVGKECRSRWS